MYTIATSMYKLPRVVDAFVKLMILSSIVHISTIAVYFLMTHDIAPLNFFSIIGTNLLFPSILTSQFATMYSLGTIITVYTILYMYFTHENRCPR